MTNLLKSLRLACSLIFAWGICLSSSFAQTDIDENVPTQAQPTQEAQSTQQELSAQNASPDDASARILPKVVVQSGPRSWQLGLEAYDRGDYVLAEKHFRFFRNTVGASVLNISGGVGFNQSLGPDQLSGTFPLNVVNSNIGGSSVLRPGSRISENERKRAGAAQVGRSGDERNYAQASYALGASLTKQGRHSEAKRYFSSALGYDRNLHDARLRLGLIALLEDNAPQAKRRLRQLERYCDRLSCEGDSELAVSVSTLRAALAEHQTRTE